MNIDLRSVRPEAEQNVRSCCLRQLDLRSVRPEAEQNVRSCCLRQLEQILKKNSKISLNTKKTIVHGKKILISAANKLSVSEIPEYYTPNTICAKYNFPKNGKIDDVELGIGTDENINDFYKKNSSTIAIISYDGTFYRDLLDPYIRQYSYIPVGDDYEPDIEVIKIGIDELSPGDGDIENMIDLCLILGCNPYAKIRFYAIENTTVGVKKVLERLIDDINIYNISYINYCWGFLANNNEDIIKTYEAYLRKIYKSGTIISASSGDEGSGSGTSELCLVYPSSSPLSLAVGATSLTSTSETTWSYNPIYGNGTCGGISRIFPIRPFQKSVIDQFIGSQNKRCVPDISLNGDPDSGYLIPNYDLDSGDAYYYIVGGTSCSTALFSGWLALSNFDRKDFLKKSFSAYLYESYRFFRKNFNDICIGNNDSIVFGGVYYSSRYGYDLCTGLGSFDGLKLRDTIKSIIKCDSCTICESQTN